MHKQERSLLGKTWVIPDSLDSSGSSFFDELLQACAGDKLVARVLAAKEIDKLEAAYYTGSAKRKHSSPSEIPNLDKAVLRIEKAIEKGEKICIYGDYDVDGTTSTALLKTALQTLGADCEHYIPNRFTEGYGLNSQAIVQIKSKKKAKLLITCDCGISNISEISMAKSIGLDVIVTDHHSLPEELPPAFAILNPKMLSSEHPLHWLPGVGVAYKLAEELFTRAGKEKKTKHFLDLVALGIIADLAPLRAENRLLAKEGLKELCITTKPGLRALLKESGITLNAFSSDNSSDEESVGFSIAPRINATGRLSSAEEAVKLFLCEDEIEASQLAKNLSEQNSQRQDLCDEILENATLKVNAQREKQKELRSIMLSSKTWHHGVIGIVASRLVESFNLPVFLAVEENETIRGSARGISAIDLFEEMSKFADLFERFGGHKAAAGFSMSKENWEIFKVAFESEMQKKLSPEDLLPKLKIDCILSPEELSLGSLEGVFKLAPFGYGFSKPVFSLQEPMEILSVEAFGKKKEHSKLSVRPSRLSNKLPETKGIFEAILWKKEASEINSWLAELDARSARIAFSASKSNFRNTEELRLEIKDIKCSEKIKITENNKNTDEKLVERDVKDFLKKLWVFCRSFEKNDFTLSLRELSGTMNTGNSTCIEGLKVLQESEAIEYKLLGTVVQIKLRGKPAKLLLNTSRLKKSLMSVKG